MTAAEVYTPLPYTVMKRTVDGQRVLSSYLDVGEEIIDGRKNGATPLAPAASSTPSLALSAREYGIDFDVPAVVTDSANPTTRTGTNPTKWNAEDPDIFLEDPEEPGNLIAQVSGLYSVSGYFMMSGAAPDGIWGLLQYFSNSGPTTTLSYIARTQEFSSVPLLVRAGSVYQFVVQIPAHAPMTPNYMALALIPLLSVD